jgi:hypothetical protein
MSREVSAHDRKAPPGSPREGDTPLSSSGVVVRPSNAESGEAAPRVPRRRRDSDPAYRLTPYQARVDVEMDDTAVSKVRDPSVSLILDSDMAVKPRHKATNRRYEAAASLALGAALGALLVVLVVLLTRLF